MAVRIVNAPDHHPPPRTVWLSVLAGLALWEIAGRSTSAAFMVPFSETLVRLWQLVARGEFIAQFLDSATLFLTGFGLALIVGAPLGLLLARVRVAAHRHRALPHDPLRHADGGADPVHPVADGFRLRAEGAGRVPVLGLSGALQHRGRRAQHQARTDRGGEILPLQRVGAVARGDAALHLALHDDRRAPGDRPRAWSA